MLNNEYVGLIERKEEILSIKESEFIFQGFFYDNPGHSSCLFVFVISSMSGSI
jgi:hypothetical protein